MHDNSRILQEIMQAHGLGIEDVARQLGVASTTARAWTLNEADGGASMPDAELRLLQYALMTENQRRHLF
jgi:transcriptional regulator with XRE-family HTH domain